MEKQRSKEWFEKRKNRITGSNVGAILGLNPFKTPDDVLREMVRDYHGAEREFTGNIATEHGTFHEAGAQAEYEMITGNKVNECGFYIHPHYDWLGASPDGTVDDDGLVEIKCPFSQRDKNPPEFKTLEEQEHYAAQVQCELHCSGRIFLDFYQWAPHGDQLETVERDDDWLYENLPALEAFYQRYLEAVESPDEYLAPKRVETNTIQAKRLIEEVDELQEAIDRAQERRKDAMAELVKLAKDRDALVWGRKLTKVEKKGSVSYAKALKVLAPNADLEKWRGKPTSFWKLS